MHHILFGGEANVKLKNIPKKIDIGHKEHCIIVIASMKDQVCMKTLLCKAKTCKCKIWRKKTIGNKIATIGIAISSMLFSLIVYFRFEYLRRMGELVGNKMQGDIHFGAPGVGTSLVNQNIFLYFLFFYPKMFDISHFFSCFLCS